MKGQFQIASRVRTLTGLVVSTGLASRPQCLLLLKPCGTPSPVIAAFYTLYP